MKKIINILCIVAISIILALLIDYFIWAGSYHSDFWSEVF